jgi:hypothetical protein
MAGEGGPPRRTCGAMGVHFALLETHPEFRQNQRMLAEATVRRRSAVQLPWKPITIPVVVHVLYNKDEENISDDQIHSQIDVLNKDFRGTNPDVAKAPSIWKGLAGDAGIQFALATEDPAGKPTNGINRVKTALKSFAVNDLEPIKFSNQGGADAWPRGKYLNLWVGALKTPILGYAQFPGGPAPTDGVAILNTAFGATGTAAPPFNLGRTATHEIGHWLNLRHIWGDEPECAADDFVEDTPLQGDANSGKPQFPHISCNNGPNGDMFMNYMDYVDDDAMFMFTVGQVSRMHAALETMRGSFLE